MPRDVFISADIEADGPIPGPYSMLSFGLAIASEFDGESFFPRDLHATTFYRELKPISENSDPDALSVSRLDRQQLKLAGEDPSSAMRAGAAWVVANCGDARPVLVGYPVVFDWMFLHWYFVHFSGSSPFGFSNALDMKTMYQQKARVTLDVAGRDDLPPQLNPSHLHTHNALDDAIEQGEIFNRLFAWRSSPSTMLKAKGEASLFAPEDEVQ